MTTWEWGTWFACAVLGPGAVAVFIWFLRDLRKLIRSVLGK